MSEEKWAEAGGPWVESSGSLYWRTRGTTGVSVYLRVIGVSASVTGRASKV